MPKAPFRLSKKWLSSPSQRFHGPPRSESQALLRKAFFAFAAHSQGGLSPGCPLHPRSQSGGQGRAPGRAGGGGVWRPGAFGPPPAKPNGWGGGLWPPPQPFAGASRPAAAPPGWPTAKRLCGPAPPGRRYAPCVLLIPPGRHTGPCPWFSRRIGWPGRGSG